MPPQQCPACGRFLKRAFVAELTAQGSSCPRCDEVLVAEMFAAEPPAADAAPEPARVGAEAEPSVRPPDLQPEQVRDDPAEVLAGWDAHGPSPHGGDRAPFPLDALVLAGAGVTGGLLGALFGEGGARGAALGAAGGVLGAAVARRVWRLE